MPLSQRSKDLLNSSDPSVVGPLKDSLIEDGSPNLREDRQKAFWQFLKDFDADISDTEFAVVAQAEIHAMQETYFTLKSYGIEVVNGVIYHIFLVSPRLSPDQIPLDPNVWEIPADDGRLQVIQNGGLITVLSEIIADWWRNLTSPPPSAT